MGLILKPDNLSQYELSSATLSMDLAPLILSNKQKTLAEIRSKNRWLYVTKWWAITFFKRMAKIFCYLVKQMEF